MLDRNISKNKQTKHTLAGCVGGPKPKPHAPYVDCYGGSQTNKTTPFCGFVFLAFQMNHASGAENKLASAPYLCRK